MKTFFTVSENYGKFAFLEKNFVKTQSFCLETTEKLEYFFSFYRV